MTQNSDALAIKSVIDGVDHVAAEMESKGASADCVCLSTTTCASVSIARDRCSTRPSSPDINAVERLRAAADVLDRQNEPAVRAVAGLRHDCHGDPSFGLLLWRHGGSRDPCRRDLADSCRRLSGAQTPTRNSLMATGVGGAKCLRINVSYTGVTIARA